MHRSEILETASTTVTGDRNKQYGDPFEGMSHVAELWNAFLRPKLRRDIEPREVAQMQVLLKCARSGVSPEKKDHYIDMCGYAAIAGEIATENRKAANFALDKEVVNVLATEEVASEDPIVEDPAQWRRPDTDELWTKGRIVKCFPGDEPWRVETYNAEDKSLLCHCDITNRTLLFRVASIHLVKI